MCVFLQRLVILKIQTEQGTVGIAVIAIPLIKNDHFRLAATSFICTALMRNDIFATLKMMLPSGQMILCLRHK